MPEPRLVGRRYEITAELGHGGMGAVYAALDRLTDSTIALKRISVSVDKLRFASISAYSDLRLALTQEFKTLASLRHPYIISVLDYGFDNDPAIGVPQPYFTMDLLKSPQSITAVARTLPLMERVRLLVQVLQALSYLHRRGVIHRDLKPDNIQAIRDDGQYVAKVLDFGLALSHTQDTTGEQDDGGVVGTLAYMAPEVLQGQPATRASDLYAVGLIAYELFTGEMFYEMSNIRALINQVTTKQFDPAAVDMDNQPAYILQRLLAKDPQDRFDDASAVVRLLSDYTGAAIPVETVAIRESFLQAAQFIGREGELKTLTDALARSEDGDAQAWLIGGESGVGKSRLTDELRTQALVDGVQVLRGQAISEGGVPYQLWRVALRQLCLQTQLSDYEASVLKDIVPDIGRLLRRDTVPDAPELDPREAQDRLMRVITDVFKRQIGGLVVLEDVHWADNASLQVLKRVTAADANVPGMFVATYRNDERPDLPDSLPAMQTMALDRLNRNAINELSQSMLGQRVGQTPELVSLLERETEGNIFFIVEVVRTLAEEAGDLENIGEVTLPMRIFSEGMKTVIQRRLENIPDDLARWLPVAAVIGRRIDPRIMQGIAPELDVDTWLAAVASYAVFDVQDNTWRFAHDKLRESLLDRLASDERKTLHGQVAQTIEAQYPDDVDYAPILVYHWQQAGDERKELTYLAIAGEQNLKRSAYTQSITYFERALDIINRVGAPQAQQAALEYMLGDAYYGAGRMTESRDHLQRSLTLAEQPRPSLPGLVSQFTRQMWHRLRLDIFKAPMRDGDLSFSAAAARACEKIGQTAYANNERMASVFYALQGLNLAERLGKEAVAEQARFYGMMTMGMGLTGQHIPASLYLKRTDAQIQRIDDADAIAWALESTGAYLGGVGQWQDSIERLQRCRSLADEIGNMRRWTEATGFEVISQRYKGDFEASDAINDELFIATQHSEDQQAHIWAQAGRGEMAWRRGDFARGIIDAQNAIPTLQGLQDTSSEIRIYGILAGLYWRSDDVAQALDFAAKALAIVRNAEPTVYTMHDNYAAIADVYLSYWERGASDVQSAAVDALQGLREFAGIFPIGKSILRTYEGRYAWLTGQQDKALNLMQKAIWEAQRYGMIYEEAIAHDWLATYLPRDHADRNQHRQSAQAMFDALGVMWHRV